MRNACSISITNLLRFCSKYFVQKMKYDLAGSSIDVSSFFRHRHISSPTAHYGANNDS